MDVIKLCKVELYRFFHSMSIIKYAAVFTLFLLFMSYFNIAFMDEDITAELVWASLMSNFLYLLAIVCVIIALYIGREFRQKTIHYEIMSGYSINVISFSKSITCGIIIPIILIACILLYFGLLGNGFNKEYSIRFIYMFILFLHICLSTVIYVLIWRNAVLGGCFAFIKFLIFESIIVTIVGNLLSLDIAGSISYLTVFNQWYALIDVENTLDSRCTMCIILSALAEYFILHILIYFRYKKCDM